MRFLPDSIYRVQLNAGFTFSDLEEYLPYFKKLGVSHLYLSPIMEAAPGSTHFYNTYDFSAISSVLGGEEGFLSLSKKSRNEGIGLILDIVPNHMTILNKFMLDYLEKGKKSRFKNLFDIDLKSTESRGKIVLPMLDFYPLEEPQKFKISNDSIKIEGTSLVLPRDREEKAMKGRQNILADQHYLLTHWKESSRIINYRRFFAVNELIAIRMERKENFDLFHLKIRDLLRKDLIQGLRIDHVDGLNDAFTYLRRLNKLSGNRPVWVEKILARDESLREEWSAEGDTGYSARARINSAFIDKGSLDQVRRIFRKFGGDRYEDEKYRVNLKIEISKKLFQSDFERYSRFIKEILVSRGLIGISVKGISDALMATIALLDRYRTYSSLDLSEVEIWLKSLENAKEHFPYLSHELTCLEKFLGLVKIDQKSASVLRRIEQFTGAVMAKSMEDCYFYRYSALLSTCLVGSMPFDQPYSDAEIHAFFAKIQDGKRRPMTTLSTHDTKFGEDAVARFNAISDLHKDWAKFLKEFSVTLEIQSYDRYRILQAILGTYEPHMDYKQRLHNYVIKALRESGENTNWEFPNTDYENKCIQFADLAITEIEKRWGLLLKKVQYMGALNSLSQTILKFMLPGIPDTYQGSESMNFSFVDPDNRRPVSYRILFQRLKDVSASRPDLNEQRATDGGLKLFVTSRLISIRTEFSDYFINGKYFPLKFSGKNSNKLFGFYYRLSDRILTVIISRHHSSFVDINSYSPNCWAGTSIVNLPEIRGKLKDLITSSTLKGSDLSRMFAEYPFTVVEAMTNEDF